MKKVLAIMVLMMFALALPMQASSKSGDGKDDEGGMNLQEIIFEHLGDAYGWEVPFSHEHRIPLPVIVNDNRGGWHVFSSSRVTGGESYDAGDGVVYRIASEGDNRGKVVQVAADGKEFRPVDLSITKDVAALIVAALIVLSVMLSLVRYYKRNGMKAPRKGMGAVEALIGFIYDGVLKNTLGEKAPKFAGFLLTAFFFIFTMNLLGLAVIFPGGANLTGNIAVTLVLAVCTFVVTNIKGNKHYWKDIFWPDVPLALKFPLPIMPVIELFGIFTKPAALCVRLFANMMGGHMIVIVLTLLIFIFAPFGAGSYDCRNRRIGVLLIVYASTGCACKFHSGVCVYNAFDAIHLSCCGRAGASR